MREKAGKNQSAQTTALRKDLIEQEKGKGKEILANNEHCPQPWVSPIQKDSTLLSPGSQALHRNPYSPQTFSKYTCFPIKAEMEGQIGFEIGCLF